MASIAMMVGGAIINAVAFTGSNFLFSNLKQKKADEERQRHDLALEKLSKAKLEYEENRTKYLDYLNDRYKKEVKAQKTFHDIDSALRDYNEVTKSDLKIPVGLLREPKLSDFYVPSEEQKNGEIVFVVGGTALVAFLVYKLL